MKSVRQILTPLFILSLLTACSDVSNEDNSLPQSHDFTLDEKFDLPNDDDLSRLSIVKEFLLENYDTLYKFTYQNIDTTKKVFYPSWACDSADIQWKNCVGYDFSDTSFQHFEMPEKLKPLFLLKLKEIDTSKYFAVAVCSNQQTRFVFKANEVSNEKIILHSIIYNSQSKKDCTCEFNSDMSLGPGIIYRISQIYNYKAFYRNKDKPSNDCLTCPK